MLYRLGPSVGRYSVGYARFHFHFLSSQWLFTGISWTHFMWVFTQTLQAGSFSLISQKGVPPLLHFAATWVGMFCMFTLCDMLSEMTEQCMAACCTLQSVSFTVSVHILSSLISSCLCIWSSCWPQWLLNKSCPEHLNQQMQTSSLPSLLMDCLPPSPRPRHLRQHFPPAPWCPGRTPVYFQSESC